MRKSVTPPVLVAAVSTALLTGALLSPAAQAITDTTFRYTTPRIGYLQIPPAAFTPTNTNYFLANSGQTIGPAMAGTACFYAPINLPDAATLTRLTFWYTRANGTQFDLVVYRQRMSDGDLDSVFAPSAAVTGTDRQARSVDVADQEVEVVDNRDYNYWIRFCAESSGTFFYGARISYSYTNAGD
jgi:hypothetical protein